MCAQVGAVTPVFYGFRDREYILNLIESVTGGRFHPNFNRIGGLKSADGAAVGSPRIDLPQGWVAECRRAMGGVFESCDTFEELLLGNEIFLARTKGVGVIPPDVGAGYGVSGSNLRAT